MPNTAKYTFGLLGGAAESRAAEMLSLFSCTLKGHVTIL